MAFDVPNFHDLVERFKTFSEGKDGKVNHRTDWRIVVQRDKGVHLQTMQEDLDHNQTRGLELFQCEMVITGRNRRYAPRLQRLE